MVGMGFYKILPVLLHGGIQRNDLRPDLNGIWGWWVAFELVLQRKDGFALFRAVFWYAEEVVIGELL